MENSDLVKRSIRAVEEINRREKSSKERGKSEDKNVFILSSPDALARVSDWLPTGILSIDRALGRGLPSGRLTEVFGDHSTGKTLLAMHLIKSAQARGCPCAVFDTEHAFDPVYARKLGVDVDAVIYSSPNTIEEVFESMERTIEVVAELFPEKSLLLIWDSVAQTSTRMEMESGYGSTEMGLRARLIGQGCRKITGLISKKKVFLLFVNQIRESLAMYGPSYVKPGGKAVGFYASLSVQINAGKDILDKEGRKKIGKYGDVYVTKSRVFPPFKRAFFESYFERGIDPLGGFVDWLCLEEGTVTKAGGWCYYNKNEKDYKFRAADVKKFILDNPEVLYEHEKWILDKLQEAKEGGRK